MGFSISFCILLVQSQGDTFFNGVSLRLYVFYASSVHFLCLTNCIGIFCLHTLQEQSQIRSNIPTQHPKKTSMFQNIINCYCGNKIYQCFKVSISIQKFNVFFLLFCKADQCILWEKINVPKFADQCCVFWQKIINASKFVYQ